MKKLRAKKIMLKLGTAVLTLGILFGSFVWVAPMVISAASGQAVSANGSEETAKYASPQYVPGKIFMGTQGLTDPEAKEYNGGTYYEPTSYVYFGSYYDSANKREISLVHRVLDADADNTGESGAMFVLSEFADLNTQFARYSDATRDHFTNENIYTQSRLSLNYYINKFATSKYTTSSYKKYYGNILEDLDYVRGVTKNDVRSEMQGLFGFGEGMSSYLWDVRDNSGVSVESAEYLSQTKFFPLSAEEMNKYVSTVPCAPGVAVKLINSNTYVGYWLRTGLTPVAEDEDGNTVGGVDENGKISAVDVYSSDMYVRYGFNIETGDIAFTEMITDNTHRLAFTEPLYKDNSENPFKAELVDVKGGVVTVKYSNAIRDDSHVIYSSVTDKNYISVMIQGKDGKIKHYGTVAEVESSVDGSPTSISSKESTASFMLPVEYEDGDKILVFWERKTDRTGAISHVSNMVELGCIHTAKSEATCVSQAVCSKCGEAYGSTDPENHVNVDKTRFEFDKDHGIHWNICGGCSAHVNVETCTVGSICTMPCKCGNDTFDSGAHSFNEKGVCEHKLSHFETPEVVLRSSNATASVTVKNEGQLIGFAKLYNSGAFTYEDGKRYSVSLTLSRDLDLSGISGYEPIGTDEYPFVGSMDGGGYSIKGIECSTDGVGVGIFGVVHQISVTNLTVSDCHFEGSDHVGVIVGRTVAGTNVKCRYSALSITDCIVSAKDGDSKGIVAGTAKAGDTVASVYTYNIKDSSGNNIRFASDPGGMVIGKSACLWDEQDISLGQYTAEQYASGEVAHAFDMRQQIGVDPAPSKDESKPVVCKVSYCDRETAYYQSETDPDNSRRYRTIHNPDVFYEFVWENSFCQASVHCSACDSDVLVTADVDEDLSYVPVRGIYTASITVGGNTYTETKEIIGIRIEDMIGMTYVKRDFDGTYVYPEDLMNNHRLVTSPPASKEYEVYFVDPKTGERYTEISYDYYGKPVETAVGVCAAGTYDLLVVGKNDYEGQSYTYKGALVIDVVTVKVTVNDVYKYYDGTSKLEPSYTLDDIRYQQGVKITYSDASGSDVGDYILSVSINSVDGIYADSVIYVLSSDTVMGYILPRHNVTVENKSYPTQITYGDSLPEPSTEHFEYTDGSELTFEWFSADIDKYLVETSPDVFEYRYNILSMTKMNEKPKAAGDYILRVKASHSDNMVGNYIEVYVEIKPRELSIELTAPEGIEPVDDEYGNPYYYLDMGETLTPSIKGLAYGETLESAGIEIHISQSDVNLGNRLPDVNDSEAFPVQPNMYNYFVMYSVHCSNGNYSDTSIAVYICINGADAPTPVIGHEYVDDGIDKKVGVVFTWNKPSGEYDDNDITYKITVKRGDETVSYNERNHAEFISNSLSFTTYLYRAGDYTVTVESCVDRKTVDTQTILFSVSFTKDGVAADTVNGMGEYVFTVTSDGNSPRSLEFVVKREISMELKEMDYFISEGTLTYDKTKVVMKAGKVILLGHELVSVNIGVYTDNGTSYIKSITVKDESGRDVSYLYSIATVSYKDHSEGGPSIVHVYDSPCDTDCNVYGCDHTRLAAHTGGTATCNSLAICENCNMEYGSYDTYRHTSEHTHTVPNPDDLMTHLVIYSCCGTEKEQKSHTPATVATCTDRAVCAECGWRYGSIDPSNHTSDEFTYSASAEDKNDHIKTRKCCGESISEPHTGGDATCKELAKCQFCSAQYGALEPDNHGTNITYTANTDDAGAHSASCSDCGKTWTESHSGGTATCKTQASCDRCQSQYGELDGDNHESEEIKYVLRAENSTMHDAIHDCCGAFISKAYHSGGEATCISAAICEVCGEQYGKKDPSNHASDEYKYAQGLSDANYHIKYYMCCGTEVSAEEHSVGSAATCERANICAECNLEFGEKLSHVYDNDCDFECNFCKKMTRPYVFHNDADGDGKCDSCQAEVQASDVSTPDGDGGNNNGDGGNADNGGSDGNDGSSSNDGGDGNKKKGCSSVASGGVALMLMSAICAVWISKKRKWN